MLALVLLAGCMGGRAARREAALRETFPPVAAAAERSLAPDGSGSESPPAAGDYRLAPQDQVVFEMFNEPDIKTTQRLSSRGEMTLPLAGTVTLAGMTLREAEQEIRRLYLEGGYFVEPHVILSVAEYGSRYVTVLGQVNRPDRIELPIETPSIGLVEAITQAGGFTRLARTDAVRITRADPERGEQHMTVDLRGFLGRSGSVDFKLRPGDVVFVPERIF